MNKSSNPTANPFSLPINGIKLDLPDKEVGTITAFGDGILRATGLERAEIGELIDLGEGELGLTLNLERENVGIVALGRAEHLHAGGQISRTGQILSLNVSEDIIGR